MKPRVHAGTATQFRTLRGARALRASRGAHHPLLTLSAVAWLSLAGCQTSTPDPLASDRVVRSDAGVTRGEQVMSVMKNLEAHALDLGSGRLHVALRRTDGRTEFAADFRPAGANYRVSSELYALDADAVSRAARQEERLLPRQPGQLLTLKSAVEGTLFMHGNVTSAVRGNYKAADYYGCDLGPLGRMASCSDIGACCDVHDQCYIDEGCSASSWDEAANSKCQTHCNAPALSCVLFATPSPGKSTCCNEGTDYCGQLRNPGEPTPTQETPANVPRWGGVEPWNIPMNTIRSAQNPAGTTSVFSKPGVRNKTDAGVATVRVDTGIVGTQADAGVETEADAGDEDDCDTNAGLDCDEGCCAETDPSCDESDDDDGAGEADDDDADDYDDADDTDDGDDDADDSDDADWSED